VGAPRGWEACSHRLLPVRRGRLARCGGSLPQQQLRSAWHMLMNSPACAAGRLRFPLFRILPGSQPRLCCAADATARAFMGSPLFSLPRELVLAQPVGACGEMRMLRSWRARLRLS